MTDPAIGLGQIRAADPTFDVTAFLNQASDSMFAVRRAVQSREPIDVFDLVSPNVYDELRTEVEGLLDRGGVDSDDMLSIGNATVAAAEHSADGDRITVLFEGDYWTFSRAASSQGPQRPECPICGAPIDIDTGRICRYCKTLMPPLGQQTGWTVVAIAPAAQNA